MDNPAQTTSTPSTQHPLLTAIINAESPQELKQAINDSLQEVGLFDDEEKLLRKIQKLYRNEENLDADKVTELLLPEVNKYANMTSLENGYLVDQVVHREDKTAAKALRKALFQEYNATSPTEKMLIDSALIAYLRSVRCSKVYTCLLQNHDGSTKIGQDRTNLLKEVGKQINLANQQFITAITFLKELHHPKVNIKVQNGQAFIAQNQQFNKGA